MQNYYSPSGRFSPISFLYFLVATFVALPILATIYSYAIWYIPFPYINFFLTAGFGFGVGLLFNIVVNRGKVRNNIMATAFGLVGGLFAYYFHWAVWIDLVLNMGDTIGSNRIGITVSNIDIFQVLGLAMNPESLFEIIMKVQEVGTWGIKGSTVSGTFLVVIWAIEALVFFALTLLIPSGASSKPFCEHSDKWFEEKELAPLSFITDPANLIALLESNNETAFDGLQTIKNPKTESHSVFTVFSNDSKEHYLSIENKLASINDKKEVKFDSTDIVKYLAIKNSLIQHLENKPIEVNAAKNELEV